jgi:predicted RNase H-like nuclease
MNYYLGIDGCRSGWIVSRLSLNSAQEFNLELYRISSLFELTSVIPIHSVHSIWIDIPVGLSDSGVRNCDSQLRKALGKKGSSVFTTPVKSAVYAENYRQACELNAEKTGKKISIQSWNICPKIKETDQFFGQHPEWKPLFVESHPEFLFEMAKPEFFVSKKLAEGYHQRLHWLTSSIKNEAVISDFCTQHSAKWFAKDDVLDSVMLAVCTYLASKLGSSRLGESPFFIHYPQQFE